MKPFSNYFIPGLCILALFLGMCKSSPEDKEAKTGKAGDQLDLFAVMNIFQNSSSPEAFEKSINSKSSGINNLDLNEDGQSDYIKVTDKVIDDQSHVLVLQVDVAAGKTQDVATVEIQKVGESEAHVQLIGDEELYGSDYIVEPKSKDAAAGFVVATTLAVNVWTWPAVTYIYSPGYVVWVSPYYYEYYPVWWEPWPVVVYDVYYPVVSVYHTHYGFSDGYRFVHVHENYHQHHRVTTSFKYSEKNHGVSHTKINVKEDHKSGDGNSKNNNDKSSDGNKQDYKGGGNDKNVSPGHDNKAKSPSDAKGKSPSGNDKNASPGGNDKAKSPSDDKGKSPSGNDNKNSGGKDYNQTSGSDKGTSAPKSDAKKSSPPSGGGMNKSSAPKTQPKAPNTSKPSAQPKGGKSGGGGGGKHK